MIQCAPLGIVQWIDSVVDFGLFLQECGLTLEQMHRAKLIAPDSIPIPGCVSVGRSSIEGQGCFASRAFMAKEVIAPARIGENWTDAGRYANHWPHPNTEFVVAGDILNMVAKKEIRAGDELTVNYRDVRSIIQPEAPPAMVAK